MMRRMREAPRPLKLTFEAALSPAAKITAAIKSRTAAAIVAAASSSSSKLYSTYLRQQFCYYLLATLDVVVTHFRSHSLYCGSTS
eukprot:COSAG02_NODE_9231_length_2283_cov_1.119048_4_plen_85_part_00